MIAVTFALPAESSLFVSRLQNCRRVSSRVGDIIFGEISSRSVAVFHTGVGRKICETKIAGFIREQHPDVLISSGFAGAASPNLEVGDLFLAQNFSDQDLVSLVQRMSGDPLHVGTLFTSPTIVDSASERNEIARKHGADAVDMETEVIARACMKNGTPMLSLRVITDSPGEPFPAPPSVLFDIARQRTDFLEVAAHFAARPTALVGMFRFILQMGRARKILTNALTKLLEHDSFDRFA
jgi:nucleoside phosphorylase